MRMNAEQDKLISDIRKLPGVVTARILSND
jgi:hypothetical protein